jgi:glycosyltransferase involved in cell wall biosynthesis
LARVPVIYVAHTLLGCELETYGPSRLAPSLRRAGALLDAAIARSADAVLALSRAGARALGPRARGPVEVIPPGLDPAPEPAPEAVASACRSRGLEPGRFVLYAGNLDAYQNLGELAAAARFLGAPVVVVTHAQGPAPAPLRTLHVDDPAEQRRLLFGAAVAVLPRRAPGGFPIKLLNYMEAARPIAARDGVADTLVHGSSAWLLSGADGGEELSHALRALLDDPELATRLGREGRQTLEREHAWPDLARRTLDLAGGAA